MSEVKITMKGYGMMKGTRHKEAVVSVIVPLRNEERYIDKCIQSILRQDYPLENMEIIFVDGLSQDKTREVVSGYVQKYYGTVKLFENPYKTVPYAMNIGIKNSTGKYIIRLDAHSEYTDDYITKCISTIEYSDADNVGGLAITKGHGFIGESFSKVLSSKFGVGNSGFRTNASSGYVDTVPFGTFKRETFFKYGLYDERLTRNQDYELNYRIRKNGGKVYLNSDIKLTYYCRNTLLGILQQSYENGRWNLITSKLCSGSMSIRHFIPLIFLLSLIILSVLTIFVPLFGILLALELGLYFLLDLMFSAKTRTTLMHMPLIFVMFFIFHISYGFGSLEGLIKISLEY